MLKPRYEELTRKRLDCDFAAGKDLRNLRPEVAAHENVVEALGEMMRILDLSW